MHQRFKHEKKKQVVEENRSEFTGMQRLVNKMQPQNLLNMKTTICKIERCDKPEKNCIVSENNENNAITKFCKDKLKRM